MNDEQLQLASAYLDGTLTDEQRARADADGAVLDAVEQLRVVRAAMSDVEPPTAARRESAIAAALARFDASITDATLPRATSDELGTRRRGRWLMPAAAAAVVVIGIGGVTAALLRSGSSDDDAADTPAADVLTAESTGDVFVAIDTIARTEAADAQLSATDTTGGTATAAATADTAGGRPALRLLATPEELVTFVADADRAPLGDAAVSPCDEGELVGRAAYLVDDVQVVVDVFRSTGAEGAGTEARAVAIDDCALVARTPVP